MHEISAKAVITNSRLCAFEVLKKCAENKAYSNIVLSNQLDRMSLSREDSALATEIVYGTVSRLNLLDFYISKFSSKPLEKLDVGIRVILQMSVYQLICLNSTPDYAVCNEAVSLAEKFYHKQAAGFVNAVLRAFLRGPKPELPNADTAYGMSIRYSVSKDIAKLLKDIYGADKANEILAACEKTPPVYLTVNTLKTTAKDLVSIIGGKAVSLQAIKLEKGNVIKTKEFENGFFFVQDIASGMAVEMLSPKAGDSVLDICSAPGGKSLKAAIMMQNQGKIKAFDLHKNKLSLIDASAKRLGISIITTAEADATILNNDLIGTADKVICDVPCSGLGVMAKKPEIRYKSLAEIEGLYGTQRKILENAAQYLKKGGSLLYSTCTINRAENEDVVNEFLQTHPSYKLKSQKTLLQNGENDGFYMAVLVND